MTNRAFAFSVRGLLANAEKTLGFFYTHRVAEELKGDSAMTLFQDDPQEAEIVSFEATADIVFCLPEHVSFKKPRPEIRLEMNHGGFQEEQTECPARAV